MDRETPAGYSRLLHKQVRAMHAEMRARGYSDHTVYVVLLDVLMRLAVEQHGDDAGVGGVLDMIEKMKNLRGA